MRSNNRSHTWWRRLHRNYKVRRYRPKMWVLPSLDLGYIKVTKVASTSIELALATWLHRAEHGDDAATPDREAVKAYSARYSHHFNPADLLSGQRPGYIFAFVRNPLERLHSSYVNKIVDVRDRGEAHNIFWNHGITLDMSFDEFVNRVAAIPDDRIDRHLRSQTSCLYAGKTCLADQVDKIESLEQAWRDISNRFGLPDIPHQNRSTRAVDRSPFSGKTARIAAERYRADIENFNYEPEIAALLEQL